MGLGCHLLIVVAALCVDVPDGQPGIRKRRVPAGLLAVLQDVELVRVCGMVVLEERIDTGWNSKIGLWRLEQCRCGPTGGVPEVSTGFRRICLGKAVGHYTECSRTGGVMIIII